jgi:hypothetical protein
MAAYRRVLAPVRVIGRRGASGSPAGPPHPAAPPPVPESASLFRPDTVSAYQAERTETQRARWQAFRILTWVATVAAGGFVAFGQDFAGSPGEGRHALTGVREGATRLYRRWVLGLPEQVPSDRRPPGGGGDGPLR